MGIHARPVSTATILGGRIYFDFECKLKPMMAPACAYGFPCGFKFAMPKPAPNNEPPKRSSFSGTTT